MSEKLVTVIMSIYNESVSELNKSINSILNQSYRNLEFIIINDNPLNKQLENQLNELVRQVRDVASSADLPHTGNSRLDCKSCFMSRFIQVGLRNQRRSRS